MKNKIKEVLKLIPNIKLDEKDIEVSLLELNRRVGPPQLLFSEKGSIK